ncbi:glycosyltransferase involved in cell wall biosynthesis [Paenibacillus sp. V4I9]|uniref:tetratricopeptide repeat-containing glycosyltransferase family 2 protein n=1 Tax=Paenibacillus sp. V4I9 TaxID=3042308 RepID=UPI00277E1345|nr:glycosyltransferase [Paenibacillus sp. V4I9]MDQ0891978.1 glycosyltransferase involved in cell wall biosynthesis [Paenibacillus sp. V4I9]
MKPLLSLCMIVKNEEKVLERCLLSVKTLVDEIIVVDTGSTDQTKAIAVRHTDKVYDFSWTNDFSAARNESIRHAAGRWILILDADEYVQPTDHDKLRKYLLEYKSNRPCGFVLNIMNFGGSGNDESNVTESTGARLFLNGKSIRYIEPIHEQLTSDFGTPSFTPYPFVIFHTGYTVQVVQEKNKSERNLSILEKMNAGEKRNNPYFCFVLGNEYTSTGREDEALEVYRRSLERSSPSDTWYFYLLESLALLEMKKGNYSKAHVNIRNGIKLLPDRTDFLCMEGILLETLGLWNAAENVFHQCIQTAEEAEKKGSPYWIIKPSYGKIVPHQSIAEIKRRKGDITGAIHHWVKTLQVQPKNYIVLQLLMDALLQSESYDQVACIIEKLYPIDQPMNKVLLHKIALKIGSNELVSKYASDVIKLGFQLDEADIVQQNLLLRNWSASTTSSLRPNSLEDSLAIAAAIVHQEVSIADAAMGDTAACTAIVQEALLAINNKTWNNEVLTNQEDRFTQTLQLLWRYGYTEVYLSLMQIMASGTVLNNMADWFYTLGLHEQALDLYSVLLENNLLHANGLKNVGVWYINCANTVEALPFLEASFKTEASYNIIGLFKEHASPEAYRNFKSIYMKKFPVVSQCIFL